MIYLNGGYLTLPQVTVMENGQKSFTYAGTLGLVFVAIFYFRKVIVITFSNF